MIKPPIEQIIAELEAFCVERGISIQPAAYDGLHIWDLESSDKDLWHVRGIQDERNPKPCIEGKKE